MAKPTYGQIRQRCDFAIDAHNARRNVIDDALDLYRQTFTELDDIFEGRDPILKEGVDWLEIVKPGRVQAIVTKYMTSFLHSSEIMLEVMPHRKASSRGEEKIVTTLEYYLRGIESEADYETQGSWKHDYVWWFLNGGMGTLKTIYHPANRGTDEFPIQIQAIDTRNIFPIFADKRPLYVVEQTERYVWDVKAELEALHGGDGNNKVWAPPAFYLSPADANGSTSQLLDTDKVTVTEYWDDEWNALYIGDVVVWVKAHQYPCIPYTFAFCTPTPLPEEEWHGRPIITSSSDAIKNEAVLKTKLQSGAESTLWPTILVKNSAGELLRLRPTPDMQPVEVDEDMQLEIVHPQPNLPMLQMLMDGFREEIQMNTLPQMMWSLPISPARSGFAEQMRFMGTEADLKYMGGQLAAGMARAFENILRITEKFARKDGFSVYSMREGQDRHELINITRKDVGGHFKVRINLRPELPKDQIQQMQMARFARETSGATGQQLLPDEYIQREVLRVSDPIAIEKQRRLEMIVHHPVVQKLLEKEAIDEAKRKYGWTNKDWEEAEEEVMGPPPGEDTPVPEGNGELQLAIPPPGMGPFGPEGVPTGEAQQPGVAPWGVSPQVLPAEAGGLGRSQVQSPEENAALAALITGSPPQGV